MSFVCELTEANTTDIEVSHIATLTGAQLASSYNTTGKFWFTLGANLY